MKAIFKSAMFVCVCKAVTDGEVRACIDDGALTVDDVGHACGAGTDCGSCQEMIEAMIAARAERRSGHVYLPVLSAAE